MDKDIELMFKLKNVTNGLLKKIKKINDRDKLILILNNYNDFKNYNDDLQNALLRSIKKDNGINNFNYLNDKLKSNVFRTAIINLVSRYLNDCVNINIIDKIIDWNNPISNDYITYMCKEFIPNINIKYTNILIKYDIFKKIRKKQLTEIYNFIIYNKDMTYSQFENSICCLNLRLNDTSIYRGSIYNLLYVNQNNYLHQ